MHKIIRRSVLALGYLALVSCASVKMSEHAKDIRSRMTLRQAESLLAAYSRPSATRGGLCMIGGESTTQLDYEAPVRVSEFVIGFSAFHAAGHGSFKLDSRDLREIRVLNTNPELSTRCRHYKTGYAVVLRPQKGLPDRAEVSVNASNQSELDWILAALVTLSPQAKLAGWDGI